MFECVCVLFCLMIWFVVFVGVIISIKICVIELCNELYQEKNLMHVLDFNEGGSRCAMNFEDAFIITYLRKSF